MWHSEKKNLVRKEEEEEKGSLFNKDSNLDYYQTWNITMIDNVYKQKRKLLL